MIRIPISPERIAAQVSLTSTERHYLLHVLRLKAGDQLEVFDGTGTRFPAQLTGEQKLELGSGIPETPSSRKLILAQALIKGDKMELVIQKATELGVSSIAPFCSLRSVVRLEGTRAQERVLRWRKIAQESARQCGRPDIPEVQNIFSFASLLQWAQEESFLLCFLYEKEKEKRLPDIMQNSHKPILLGVGPEGGFDDSEIQMGRENGAQTVSLGQRILRTETAGLAAVTIIRFLDGEL